VVNHPLFSHLTEINLEFLDESPYFSLQSLSISINIAQIVQIELQSNYFSGYNRDILRDIGIFLEQAHNLSSLIIKSSINAQAALRTFEKMYPIIPCQLKHLQIPIINVDQIKRILEKCEKLSTIRLDIKAKFSEEIIQWFNDNTINSTCTKGYRRINVWLGKKKIQPTDIRLDNKRIKLTDDRPEVDLI